VTGWDDIASIATIVGAGSIVLAFLQIRHQSNLARSTFENLFVQQYHQLVQRLPAKALLGATLTQDERQKSFGEFYHYIDLCNTQAYHHRRGRISHAMWEEWSDGIKSNLEGRDEFRQAWSYIAHKTKDSEFEDLRDLVNPDVYDDNRAYLP
jgi:hypothetical protein